MEKKWTVKYAQYCTCEDCKKTPLLIAREFTQYFNVGYEWEDSITEQYCFSCWLKNVIIGKFRMTRNAVRRALSNLKLTATVLSDNRNKGIKKPLKVYWGFYQKLNAIR